MKASTATWQILGNQVIMARMALPANVGTAQNAAFASPTPANQAAVGKAISDFLTAKATRFGVTAAALAAGATPAAAAAAGAGALTPGPDRPAGSQNESADPV